MLGMKECHGDYVGFCDSDDYLEPEGYDHASQVISQQKCDLYITPHKVHFGKDIYTIPAPFGKGLYMDDRIKQEILPQAFGFLKGRERLHGFMWKHIYRKDILLGTNICLIEDLKPWEDQIFNIDMLQHCRRVYVDDVILYNYFANTGSVTSSMINSFDADDFWRKTRLLFLEKSKRATNSVESRANANSSLANLDSLIVCLCKNKSLSTSAVVEKLRSLIKKDEVAGQILNDSAYNDFSQRFRFVKMCLRFGLYRILVSVIRYKIN